MPAVLAWPGFLAGAIASLITSFVLVARLERVGERLGLSEALLGLVAALAADAPEITAAVTAVADHEQRVGAGVIIGSNVFNLAALLGLGAVVAGRIGLHRKVVVLGGAVAIWVAGVCLAVVLGLAPAAAGLILALAVVALYVFVLGAGRRGLARLPLPQRSITWLRSAVSEEELELEAAIRPRRGRWQDAVAAVAALIVVIVASVTMERAASALGSRYAVPEIVVGGLVLAAVTSLPNAVAAVYLAARGRGSATLSTALNSNTLNVTAGLLLPAAVIGWGRPSGQALLITVWYVVLTVAVLAFAYRDRGIGRGTGILIIAAYGVFTTSVLMSAYAISPDPRLLAALGAAAAAALAVWVAVACRAGAGDADATLPFPRLPGPGLAGQPPGGSRAAPGNGHRPPGSVFPASSRPPESPMTRESLVPGWPVGRLWALGLALPVLVAATDAALGHRVVLIGLLIVGPCCALLTGRWVPTMLTGLWVIGLAVVLGVPDGIWGTTTHLVFLSAVAVVALANTLAAALIRNVGP
jgi:cation:H+ antiporter